MLKLRREGKRFVDQAAAGGGGMGGAYKGKDINRAVCCESCNASMAFQTGLALMFSYQQLFHDTVRNTCD
jgi:hypothetical protein